MNNQKKAQVWYLDFMVGVLILASILIIYYQYYGNITDQSEAEWEEMIIDSKSISSALISEGYPVNWTNETAQILGLTDGNYRINISKLLMFENTTYQQARSVFKTRFNFYFFLQDEDHNIIHEKGINATDPQFLVHTTRFVIYNSSIYRMRLYLWKA